MASDKWLTIKDMTADEQKLFDAEKAAYHALKAAKAATEAKLRERLGPDTVYSRSAWGTISVSLGEPKEASAPKAQKPQESAADWLKRQREMGYNH